ncbi:hypothetical protein [Rhodopirellula baltica]|nr:hypothetical protein [Rhodopirellula baltica]
MRRMLLREISRSYVGQTLVVASGGITYLFLGWEAGLVVAAAVLVAVVVRLIQRFLRV